MKDWLIRKLGGVTMADHERLREAWDSAVATLKAQDKVTLIEGPAMLDRPHIVGTLVVAPNSGAVIMGGYFEARTAPENVAA